ncbi:MAG: hypothetical protein B6I37_04525 [Desulfobacteraceae bacterium 4572_35.2]|nr:MAG: hypothetical protein B6I37_04525 [Desulfobacteraceae bacterium 4572_35.2]
MAILAADNPFGGGDGRAASSDAVLLCGVAFAATEIEVTHVDITFGLRLGQIAAHVGVFDGVTASTAKVTTREIKSGVAPAISCVTTCATRLVADDAHSVVVKGRRPFAVFYLVALILGVGGGSAPQPMCRMQHVIGFIFMAAQALGGHL